MKKKDTIPPIPEHFRSPLYPKLLHQMLADAKKGCQCQGVEIGSYSNQVELKAPSWSIHKTICVDRCLSSEILYLWHIGIKTTGCCCGHQAKALPYITVLPEFEWNMVLLEYKSWTNSFGVKCFVPRIMSESFPDILKSRPELAIEYFG